MGAVCCVGRTPLFPGDFEALEPQAYAWGQRLAGRTTHPKAPAWGSWGQRFGLVRRQPQASAWGSWGGSANRRARPKAQVHVRHVVVDDVVAVQLAADG